MNTINIAGHNVAVAMTWRLLTGMASTQAEIRTIAREVGAKYGILVSSDTVSVVGLSREKSTAACGAAWLAAALGNDDSILIERVGMRDYWVCTLSEGAPLPGHDMVIEGEEAMREKVAEILRSGSYRIYSSIPDLPFEITSPKGFAELVTATPVIRIRQVAGVNLKLAGVSTLVLLLAIGYFVGDNLWQERKRKLARDEVALATAQREAAARQNEEQVRREAIEDARTAIINEILSQPAATAALAAWRNTIHSMPVYPAGWTLVSAECSASRCSARYERGPLGTMESFRVAAAEHRLSDYSLEPDSATISLPSAEVPRREANTDSLPGDTFFETLTTRMQGLRLAKINGTPTRAEAKPIALPGPPGEKPVMITDIPWKRGALQVSGTSLFGAWDMGDYLADPNIAVTRMSVEFRTGAWQIHSIYASRQGAKQ